MKNILGSLLLLLLIGCATFEANKKNTKPTVITGIDEQTTNIFLIGDAGQLENNNTPKALLAMQKNFSSADKNDILFFLGDNIYPKGYPNKKNNNQKAAKKALKSQIDVAKTFPGKVYFVPGNHDWYSGLKGLKNQEKMVEKHLGKNSFLPENGCAIEKINLNDDIVLLIVDSHWYITNWDKHPTINNDCAIKTRELFLNEFRSEIKKARGKTTLVITHHPMFSNGSHNGQYTLKSHMTPLPILGSLKNIIRTTSGASNTDMSNWFYNDLRKNLIAASQQNENVIFLSGHEHNLQYIKSDNLTQIVSGSGSKTSGLKVNNDDDFGVGTNGYAILNVYNNQRSEIQFLGSKNNQILFKKELHKGIVKNKTNKYPNTFKDSVTTTIFTTEETNKSNFHQFLWGERFRKYYSKPIKAKTVDLDTLYGGLTPVRKGGGNQSRSLRLKDQYGRQYVMRALKKSATQYIQAVAFGDQYIQGQFEDTETATFVSDFFTGSHPYAPLAIEDLSEKINVFHLNPKLYYIPKQNALKEFNKEFGDELYFLEEHASTGHEIFKKENFNDKIISTLDVLEELHKDEDIIVDQRNYIRARLFDMLIGDWDRHHDQWKWLQFKESGKTVYRALPRDRDQVFSKMSDGFLMSSAVALSPEVRLLRKYSPDLKDVKGVNIEPYPLDKIFIPDTDKKVWDEEVTFIQNNITDELIETAFSKLPKEVQDESIVKLKKILKQRRKNLDKIANRYYDFLFKYPVITATNKKDHISIKGFKDGKVEISFYRKKKNKITDRYLHNIYSPDITKEIWIYGLDDDDTFEVVSKSTKIKIRLIGGQNNDEYIIKEGKNIFVYDYKSKKNNVSQAKKAKVNLSDDYETHTYNFRKKKSSSFSLVPYAGYNPDDGFKLGLSNTYTNKGFERNPFTSEHKIKAAYYFATRGYEVSYHGEIANILKDVNFRINGHFQSPNYTYNFFGYGNETENFDDDLGLNFNRIRVRSLTVAPSLVWYSHRGSTIDFGFKYESMSIQNLEDRFPNASNIPEYLFKPLHYVGATAGYKYVNYDNKYYPTNGLLFSFKTGYTTNTTVTGQDFGYVIPELGVAHKLNRTGNWVLATKLKSHVNIGNGYEFYQAATIGGADGLRGFRNQRFTGKTSFYQNTDIRYSFDYTKTALIPIKLGFFGSLDYGRVWQPNQSSKKWHNSYGGGFFINGAEMISSNLGVFNSVDGLRVSFGLGFGF